MNLNDQIIIAQRTAGEKAVMENLKNLGLSTPAGEEQPMTEEYTGPRRCDLCQHEKDLPCPGKGCNIVNDLKDFKPKGSETEDTGCATCPHWAAVKIGKFCPDCAHGLK